MTFVPSPGGHWGVLPILCRTGTLELPAYTVFACLGLATGLLVYGLEARRQHALNEGTLWVLLAAIAGGTVGAKLPVLALHFRAIVSSFPDLGILLSGRSIVGALAVGALAVFLAKRRLGIHERKGGLFAPAIAAGVAVGRLGCFLQGCCYGTPTRLPWGVDFGDGVPRHPTQLYESAFLLAVFVLLVTARSRTRHPAAVFWCFMTAYFAFRFAVEFIRVEPAWLLGLTLFQWLSAALVLLYGLRLLRLFVVTRSGADGQ